MKTLKNILHCLGYALLGMVIGLIIFWSLIKDIFD